MAGFGEGAETARKLCHRQHTVCDRKKRSAEVPDTVATIPAKLDEFPSRSFSSYGCLPRRRCLTTAPHGRTAEIGAVGDHKLAALARIRMGLEGSE